MKKHLFLFSSVLVLLMGCSSDVEKISYFETRDFQERIYPHIKNFPFEISVVEQKDKKLIDSRYNIKIFNMKNKKNTTY